MTFDKSSLKSLANRLPARVKFLGDEPGMSLKPTPNQCLLTRDEIPESLREPFILTGYRPLHRPWKYYLQSILRLHNETLNVWTHVIGFVILLIRLLDALKEFNVFEEKVAWPLLCFGVCCLLCMVLSVTAHLLHSKSVFHHYTIFLFDYASFTFYLFGSGMAYIYISASKTFYDHVHHWYLWGNVFFSWFAFFAMSLARTKLNHNRTKRHAAFLFGGIFQAFFGCAPFLFRYYECYTSIECQMSTMNHITAVIFMKFLTCASFSAHVPERWMPGHFDIFGHSHQFFHIISVTLMLFQFNALKVDIEHYRIHETFDPNPKTICLSLLTLIFAETITLIYFIKPYRSTKVASKKIT